MSTVQPTDKVLVNRSGTDHSATADTLMATIQDTDWLLVNRAGVDYKCSGLDFKAAMVPPESVDKPSLTSPSDGATDVGKTPTFTSSAFSGTGATHASTDWQVTTAADTGFAAIVTQSMADTTNLVSWKSGDLAADTDYIARVRYHSAGAVSPWSDVIGFKTAGAFSDVLSDPGDLWLGSAGGVGFITTPVKMVALHVMDDVWSVGVDKKLYTGTVTAVSVTPVTLPDFPNSGHGSYAAVPCNFVMPDGSLVSTKGTIADTYTYTVDSKKAHQVVCNSSSTNTSLLMMDGSIYTSVTPTTGTDWTLRVAANADRASISAGSYDWAGSSIAPAIFAVNKDGTVQQYDWAGGGLTSTLPITGIKQFCCIYNGWLFALKSDGSEILAGGLMTNQVIATSYPAPAGEKWAGMGGGYAHCGFRTESGRVFVISSNFVRFPADAFVGNTVPPDRTLAEIAVPRPVNNLSLQKMAAGGYSWGFIIP